MGKRFGRNQCGTLYRRFNGKKYYDLDDPDAAEGIIWLRYMQGGKTTEQSLNTSNVAKAKQEQASIIGTLKLASEEEVLTLRLNRVKSEKQKGWEKQNPPLKLSESWAAYFGSSERPDTGNDTLRYYKSYLDHFIDWLKEKHPEAERLLDITSDIAQQYTVHLNNSKFSPNTYNKHVSFLCLMFNVLAVPAHLNQNPFAHIRKKKLQTSVRRELTIEELKNILGRANGDLMLLLYLGVFTGLRLGDCCTLKWSEVDLDRGLIRRVPNKTKTHHQKPVLVGIPPILHSKLAEIPKDKHNGFVLPKYAENYLYRNPKGSPTRQADIVKEIQAHFIDCGISTIREGTGFIERIDPDTGAKKLIHSGKRAIVEVGFHSLRHTYVSLHAERGTSPAIIQAVVGHGNPAMTAHYTHIGEDATRRAAGALDLSSAGKSSKAPLPDWAKQQITEIKDLIGQFSSKGSAKLKKELLGRIEALVQ